MASDPGRPTPPPSLAACQGDDLGGEKQRLLKLLPERPSHERREVTHNAILERDTIQHHAASPFCRGGVTGASSRCFGFIVGRRQQSSPFGGSWAVLTQSSRRTRPGQTIDPIVSCPAPPPTPTVANSCTRDFVLPTSLSCSPYLTWARSSSVRRDWGKREGPPDRKARPVGSLAAREGETTRDGRRKAAPL